MKKIDNNNPSNNINFVYDASGQLIAEYDDSDNLLNEYIYLNGISVALIRNSNLYYIYPDHLGTPRTITDTSNNPVWTWENTEPFGNNLPNETISGSPFKFNLRLPGQYFDNESNLNYNYYRDYNSMLGRYIQSDPIGLQGGINTYGYVGGSSLDSADELGLAINLSTGAIGAIIGGIAGMTIEGFSQKQPHYAQAFTNGAIAGGISGLTLGLASGPIATVFGGRVIGGVVSSAAVGASGNLAQQGYKIASGQQACMINEGELLLSTVIPAGMGSVLMRPGTAVIQNVTAWGPKNASSTIGNGSWVMTGEANIRNYGFSGTWGRLRYPYSNSTTESMSGSKLTYPSGWEGWKGYIGQRVVKE